MSPRPRKVEDEAVLQAALRVMNRVGPNELTLAEIAQEAGLTAGALVQRFGSKRALLLELASRASTGMDEFFAGLRAQHKSPLAALRAYAECTAHLASSPAALARSLAYLQIDLSDADFRKHLVAQARATRAGLRGLIEEAIATGELKRDTDPERLARTIETILGGSLLTWAHYRTGPASKWLQEDMDAALQPFLQKKRR